jgi:hypothetical protein
MKQAKLLIPDMPPAKINNGCIPQDRTGVVSPVDAKYLWMGWEFLLHLGSPRNSAPIPHGPGDLTKSNRNEKCIDGNSPGPPACCPWRQFWGDSFSDLYQFVLRGNGDYDPSINYFFISYFLYDELSNDTVHRGSPRMKPWGLQGKSSSYFPFLGIPHAHRTRDVGRSPTYFDDTLLDGVAKLPVFSQAMGILVIF